MSGLVVLLALLAPVAAQTADDDAAGDIRFAGGQLQVDGPVGGDVAVVGGSAELDGDVGFDVLTVVDPEDVTVGEDDEPTFGDRLVGVLYRFVALFLVSALALLVLRRPLEAVLTRAGQRPWASLLSGLIAVAALVALPVVSIVLGIVWSILFGLLGLGLLVGTYWFVFVVLWLVVAFVLFLLVLSAAGAIVLAMRNFRAPTAVKAEA